MNTTRIMRVIVAVSILAGVLWTRAQAQSQGEKSPGATKAQQPQDKQKVEKRSGATKGPIHADVRGKLERSEDGTVYVLVTLKPLPKEGLTKEQRKAMAKEKQDKLLSSLAEGEFTVDHRFETEPRMIGHVNAAGLDKLKSNANVEAIEPSIIGSYVFPALKDSTTGRIDLFIALEDDDLKTLDPGEQEQRIVVTQDRVLALFTNKEFKRTSWYTNIATLTGWGGAGALEKLATCPDVEAVGQNLKLILPPPRPRGSRPAAAAEKEQTM